MKKMMNWVLAAIFICSANVFTACVGSNDNPLPTPDETQPNLQGDFQQLINHHSISDLLWSAGKPCKTLDITDVRQRQPDLLRGSNHERRLRGLCI